MAPEPRSTSRQTLRLADDAEITMNLVPLILWLGRLERHNEFYGPEY